MRVVVHAGLHKTGTTYVQKAWLAAYGRKKPQRVWYPPPTQNGPGHAAVAAWLCDYFGNVPSQPLPDIVAAAESNGVEWLLLNSEDFAHIAASDTARLHEAVGAAHSVTVLLTLTSPVHRWPSMWQEVVKHGGHWRQAECRDQLTALARMVPGGLRELIDAFAVPDVRVRLVRSSPHEVELATDLQRLAGLSDDVIRSPRRMPKSDNRSIGHEATHLLRALNEIDPRGLQGPLGQALLAALNSSPRWQRAASHGPVRLDEELQPYVAEVAAAEAAELVTLRDTGRITLSDPHDLLRAWSSGP